MNYQLFICAVLLMSIGHWWKCKRWALYIGIYEQAPIRDLLKILSVGHAVNAILPLRLGDVYRSLAPAKYLKNGYPLSISTVVADIYVDVVFVGLFFLGIELFASGINSDFINLGRTYIFFLAIIFFVSLISIANRQKIKFYIRKFASLFNARLELFILYVTYISIAIIKDIFFKIGKVEFLFYSILMWICYFGSYYVYARSLTFLGYESDVFQIFGTVFSMNVSNIEISMSNLYFTAYLIAPLFVCWVSSFFVSTVATQKNAKLVLPQINDNDRVAFLNTYYKDENREHITAFLEMNNDVLVLENNSSGSNATTITIVRGDKLFYRKYAFDSDVRKIIEQVSWIDSHRDLNLPVIASRLFKGNFAAYDMNKMANAMPLFVAIHTMPIDYCWSVISLLLNDMESKLYAPSASVLDIKNIETYIDLKVFNNLDYIKSSKYIKNLEKYKSVNVNGRSFDTLGSYERCISKAHLLEVFSCDPISDVHGDLTIENVVLVYNSECKYYLIDPNPMNIHNTKFIDLAKLLQSLRGSYEFLTAVNNVEINENSVNYIAAKTVAYEQLQNRFQDYLNSNFTQREIMSIYYHEMVHWMRLLPYKINRNEKSAVIYYTALLELLDYISEIKGARKKVSCNI